jgi:hypothetical protein
MNSELYKNVTNSSAYRSSREENAHLILTNSQLFPDLLAIALNTADKNHYRGCWILELALEKQPHLLTDYLAVFCENLSKFINESALRSISKICMFLSQHISLTTLQEEQITENCFDWLIQEERKVATKVFAIRTLFELGKKQDWIYPELHRILSDDYRKHSAAYKAVTREILKKIK